MSEYTPKNEWHPAIRQFDINEIVEGGATGLDNIPHQQLADNISHILERLKNAEIIINSNSFGGSTPIDPIDPTDPPEPEGNPTEGTWTMTQLTTPAHNKYDVIPSFYRYSLQHSSMQMVRDVNFNWRQYDSGGTAAQNATLSAADLTAQDTDANGALILTVAPKYHAEYANRASITVTAAGMDDYIFYSMLVESSMNTGGGGSSAAGE